MLTHEELMEKCQELRQAASAMMNAVQRYSGNYLPSYICSMSDHDERMTNLINRKESLLSVFFENRDSILHEDAKEIITMLNLACIVEGYALGCDTYNAQGNMMNIQFNLLEKKTKS